MNTITITIIITITTITITITVTVILFDQSLSAAMKRWRAAHDSDDWNRRMSSLLLMR